MTKLSFLGGVKEVGRSANLVDTGTEKILLDYGLKLETRPVQYPKPVNTKLNAMLLSHAHLDHCGAVPALFHEKQKCPIFGLEISRLFSKLLWHDSLKIARYEKEKLRYSEKDIETALKKFFPIKYREPFKIGKTTVTAFDAGHIPGSVMFLLEKNGKTILYTGDFNTSDTRLVAGADMDIPHVDALIIESTYAGREQPNRQEQELKLIENVKNTLVNNGIAIIPCFAISRAQEILLVLDEYGINSPIYMDGMAQKATDIINQYPNLQNEYNAVKNAMVRTDIKFVDRSVKRKKIIKQPCVIITTSGMLSGGAVVYYIKKLFDRDDCSLLLTGFQVPGTEGDNLLKTGRYVNEDLDLPVEMNVKKFNFSSHADRSELFDFVKKVNPKQVFCVHGDGTKDFAEELRQDGFDAVAPSGNEVFEV